MEGIVWASVGGVAFGLFQATNRRANRAVDPYLATFAVIVVSLVVLIVLAFVTEEPTRLLDADATALLAFCAAGITNFFLGWTFLSLAQQRAGAARTSVVAGTAPLFGTAIAFLTVGEAVRPLALAGVVLVVVGVGLLAGAPRASATGPAGSGISGLVFALLTALSWGASAVLARHGLDQVDAPLSGVSVGMAASAVLYAVGLAIRRQSRRGPAAPVPAGALAALAAAGVFVAIGMGAQWIALGLVPIAVVLALSQLAVPVVLLVAPLVVGTPGERLTRQSFVGAALALAGTLLIIAARGGSTG